LIIIISKPTLSKFISSGKVLLLDGATGSRLIASGWQPGCCPELWNIEEPDKVKNVAGTYFEAGSDTVLTNTFGGSLLKLRDYGLEGRANEFNEAAEELSRAGALAVGSNCGNGLEKTAFLTNTSKSPGSLRSWKWTGRGIIFRVIKLRKHRILNNFQFRICWFLKSIRFF